MNIYDIELRYKELFNISVDTWKELLINQEVFTDEMNNILSAIYSFVDHSATVKELELLTNIDYHRINLVIGTCGKKIKEFLNITESINYNGRELYYPLLFIGYNTKNGFLFEIRNNLRIAMEDLFTNLEVKFKHDKQFKSLIFKDQNNRKHNLLEDIKEIVTQYPDEKKKKFGKTPFFMKMTRDMNSNVIDFVNHCSLSSSISSSMHVGQGNWANTPWIGIHDKQYSLYERFSFQNSFHISYIINMDDQNNPALILELNQGFNSLDLSKNEIKEFLNELYDYLNFIPAGFKTVKDDSLNFYTLLSKTYMINSLTEDELEEELRCLLSVYEHILPFHYKLLKKYLQISLARKVLSDFNEIMTVYPSVINQPLKEHPFANRMRHEFADNFKFFVSLLTDSDYIVKISHGMGSWIKRPWLGLRLDSAAQGFEDGLYIIYHFNFEMNNVDLSINQGISNYGGKRRKIVIDRANNLSKLVKDISGFTKDNDPDFKTTETSVLFKYIDLNNITPNKFIDDLVNLMDEYESIIPEYNSLIEECDDMVEEGYGLLNVNNRNIWRIIPGKKEVREDIWNECKDKGFISIGFDSGKPVDYSKYKSVEEIRDVLLDINQDIDENTTAPQMVWNFVNEIKVNDIIVANNGRYGDVYGIGIVKSEYISPEDVDFEINGHMKHIRLVDWIIDEEFSTGINFDIKTLSPVKSENWNKIVKAYNELDENLKNESFKLIYNEFKNNYYYTLQSEELRSKYFECSEQFKKDFNDIKISLNDGNDETDRIFYNLINPRDTLFANFASDIKQFIKKTFNRSEEDLNRLATKYLNLIDNYTSNDGDLRVKLIQFDSDELTKSIKTAYISASLYYLDNNRFYTINKKTISSIKFLSNYVDINIDFDNKLVNYIESNEKYHRYIEKIGEYIPDLGSFETFDHFAYWLSDKKLGYYADSGKLPLCIKNFNEEDTTTEIIETRSFNINPDNLDTNLIINKNTLYQAAAILNSSKNIIFEGVPGTGKTVLAKDICEHAKNEHFCNDYIITTATSDWTTYDVIGGLMPDINGNLNFEEGIFLKAIRENKLLIIDEINRADIDKAFGQLFTVLSGSNVELNYKIDGNNIKIGHTENLESYYDNSTKTYYIGKNFRILATMNNYDKDSLYELSYAFMRRFAFTEINIPNPEEYNSLIDKWNEELVIKLSQEYVDSLKLLLNLNQYRKLGPAIYYDVIQYMDHRLKFESDQNILEEVILSFIIPQFEGLTKNKLKDIKLFLVQNNLVNESIIDEKFEELLGLNF